MAPTPPPRYLTHRTFDDFDDLVSDARQWDLDLRQIDRGIFHGEVLQFGIENIHIAEARFGRVLDQRGAPPAGLRTIGVPADRNVSFIWRGQQVQGNNLVVFPRGAELESVSSPNFHIYTCSFPEELLDAICATQRIDDFEQLRGPNEVIDCRPNVMMRLRRYLKRVCDAVRCEQSLLHKDSFRDELTSDLPRKTLHAIAESQGVCPAASIRRRNQTVTRAQTFIEFHARDAITVKDVCKAAGVSQRTLQYAFESRFGVTPKAFLLAYRLNVVRRELRISDPLTTKIVEIANDYEFWHMGRFAANYRQLFMELPSDTLRRTNHVTG